MLSHRRKLMLKRAKLILGCTLRLLLGPLDCHLCSSLPPSASRMMSSRFSCRLTTSISDLVVQYLFTASFAASTSFLAGTLAVCNQSSLGLDSDISSTCDLKACTMRPCSTPRCYDTSRRPSSWSACWSHRIAISPYATPLLRQDILLHPLPCSPGIRAPSWH